MYFPQCLSRVLIRLRPGLTTWLYKCRSRSFTAVAELGHHLLRMTPAQLQNFVDAIEDKTGWKKAHSAKAQALMSPDSIIAHCYIHDTARDHDITLYRISGLQALLMVVLLPLGMHAFGDLGYISVMSRILLAYIGCNLLTFFEYMFNRCMRRARITIKLNFGKVVSLWPALDFTRKIKINERNLYRHIDVAVLLTSCHTCFYRSEVSQYFDVEPPRIWEYLS
eukprot:g81083.t1